MTSIGDSMKWLGIGASDQSHGGLNVGATAQDALKWVRGNDKREDEEDDEDDDEGDNADNSERQRQDTREASSPGSALAHGSGGKALKDRNCPFCGQAFTSSSLGRHLDLYVKPKNPKPADGIHDVDEIRKLRGGITRRQPRTSTKGASQAAKDKPRTWDAAQRHNQEDQHPPSKPESAAQSPQTTHERRDTMQTFINAPNWQATGVINNLPPRSGQATPQVQPAQIGEGPSDNSGRSIYRPSYQVADPRSSSDSIWKLQEAAEQGNAAELALREVLGSLEAARQRVEPIALFDDFDFFSMSLPGLCLATLSAPGTLFSPAPFPSPDSWSLQPPQRSQRDAVARKVGERVRERRRAAVDRGEHEWIGVPDEVVFKHSAHIEAAWDHWTSLPANEQSQMWTLEILRAFAREKDTRSRRERELERERQHSKHLEMQYDRLARCQLPREWQLRPPMTIPIPPAISQKFELKGSKSGVSEADYDIDVLLEKWKANSRIVSRAPRAGSSAQPPSLVASASEPQHTPNLATRQNIDPSARTLESEIVMNGSVWGGIGGPMGRDFDNWPRPNPSSTRDGHIVSYETPPQPGTVMSAEGDDVGVSEHDPDAESNAQQQNRARSASYVDHGALAKQRQFVDAGSVRQGSGRASVSGSSVNSPSVNGLGAKRSLPHGTPEGGRGKTPRVLRADAYGDSSRLGVGAAGKTDRNVSDRPPSNLNSLQTFGLLPFGMIGETPSSDDDGDDDDASGANVQSREGVRP
ncbi:hypothetical protein K431DRAFT_289054 [Polychaeton citri CBS 116435]|uniref:Uncharacterized protein n=1 Tax=Polychaeton citri CBS 116435 TaxID=1314669 RepID=A0A9P4Q2C5_9PEZI|nr:hypothetical protein K431DRAFT_289054 [Polychaeton citri CBS 116435]